MTPELTCRESSFIHSYQAPLLIYVGRLGVEKRLRDLRDVLSKLPGARLAFVGKGPDMDGLREYFAGESVPPQPRALNPHTGFETRDGMVPGTPTVFTGLLQGEELSRCLAV